MGSLFHPYIESCEALIEKPSPQNLSRIKKLIFSRDRCDDLRHLQDFLLLPHQMYLRNPSLNENYTIETLHFIRDFLKKIRKVDSAFLFKDLLYILMKLDCKSEDFKTAVAMCVGELFHASDEENVIPLDEDDHRYQLSHVVFNFLTWIEAGKSSELIKQCLLSLNIILNVYSHTDLIIPMCPGILSKLIRTLKNQNIKTHCVIECLSLWRRTLSEHFLRDYEDKDIKSLNHVVDCLKELIPCSYHEHPIIRQKMAELFESIKTLSYFLEDSVELAASLLSFGEKKVLESFVNEENVQEVSRYASSKVHAMTDIFSDCELSRLCGFVLILEHVGGSNIFFQTESYLHPFLKTLLRLGRIKSDSGIVKAFVECHTTSFGYEDTSDIEYIFKNEHDALIPIEEYVYLKTPREIELFTNICRALSNSNVMDAVATYIIEGLRSEDDLKIKDSLNIIPKILCKSLNSFIMEELADVLLTLTKHPNNVGECLTSLIVVAPKSLRKNYLPECLNFNMVRVNEKSLIKYALDNFAKVEGFESVHGLLQNYSGSLCQSLCMILRVLEMEECPILLLKVVLLFKDKSEDLRDVFFTLLGQLDLSWICPDKSFTTKILQIIKTSVLSFVEEVQPSETENALQQKKALNFERGAITKLVENLIQNEIKESELIDESVSCPEDGFHTRSSVKEEEEEKANDEDSHEEINISCEQNYLRKCISHTRHFVSMVKCPRWQILSLEIICHCLKIADLPDDSLLPLVHQVWQPLRLLFESDNIFIVDRAFSLLNILALTSKDFIRRRSEEEAFPHILKYVNRLKLLEVSSDKSSSLIGKQASKLLKKVCKGLWDFAELMDLDEMRVHKLITFIGEVENEHELRPKRDIDEDAIFFNMLGNKN